MAMVLMPRPPVPALIVCFNGPDICVPRHTQRHVAEILSTSCAILVLNDKFNAQVGDYLFNNFDALWSGAPPIVTPITA